MISVVRERWAATTSVVAIVASSTPKISLRVAIVRISSKIATAGAPATASEILIAIATSTIVVPKATSLWHTARILVISHGPATAH